MPPETRSQPDGDVAYQRAYAAVAEQAFQHTGYLSATALQTLKLSAGPDVVDSVLLHLHNSDLLHITHSQAGEVVYDFLPLLEKMTAETTPESDMHLRLSQLYCRRHLWTCAISELRITRMHPELKKESLYLLGYCFEQKGAVQRAQESYERLLAEDYGYRDARSRLEHLHDAGRPAAHYRISGFSAFDERYEIIRELGRGGAGVVYQAIDVKLRRDVALKVLYTKCAASDEHVAVILHEARLAAQLDHPNLIDIYDVNIEARCITMEYVNGGTLRTLLRSGEALPIDVTRSIMLQLCQGLHVAHAAGVLHRDIKPANIFLTQQRIIKLGDFGIAHITANAGDKVGEQVRFSSIMGTLPYMSPEQVSGQSLTAASDIYALGIVWYEMLTGTPPFSRGDISYHHQYTEAKPPGISEGLDSIVLQCLAKDPAARFQSATELRKAIRQQAQDEQSRLGSYRELLEIAMLDQNISEQERRILHLKQAYLGLSEQETVRVEKELGFNDESPLSKSSL